MTRKDRHCTDEPSSANAGAATQIPFRKVTVVRFLALPRWLVYFGFKKSENREVRSIGVSKPRSFKDRDRVWRQTDGESRSQEDALLEREHDDPAAIKKEAAKEGISVESYLHMRTNREQLARLKRILK